MRFFICLTISSGISAALCLAFSDTSSWDDLAIIAMGYGSLLICAAAIAAALITCALAMPRPASGEGLGMAATATALGLTGTGTAVALFALHTEKLADSMRPLFVTHWAALPLWLTLATGVVFCAILAAMRCKSKEAEYASEEARHVRSNTRSGKSMVPLLLGAVVLFIMGDAAAWYLYQESEMPYIALAVCGICSVVLAVPTYALWKLSYRIFPHSRTA